MEAQTRKQSKGRVPRLFTHMQQERRGETDPMQNTRPGNQPKRWH